MKLFYMRSTCCITVLNKGLKLELHLLKQPSFIFLSDILYMLNMETKTFTATSDGIHLMEFYPITKLYRR